MLRTGSYSFVFKEKGLPRLCLAMTLGCEEDDRFCCGREKEPGSHVYMW